MTPQGDIENRATLADRACTGRTASSTLFPWTHAPAHPKAPERPFVRSLGAVLLALVALSLACGTPPPANAPVSPPFQLDAAQQAEGWQVLFGGGDLSAWRGFRSDSVPASWQVVASAIYFDGRMGGARSDHA